MKMKANERKRKPNKKKNNKQTKMRLNESERTK